MISIISMKSIEIHPRIRNFFPFFGRLDDPGDHRGNRNDIETFGTTLNGVGDNNIGNAGIEEAFLGIAGKDILLEYEPDIYELLDLDIGKCRMAVAGKKDFVDDRSKTLRVATKFSNIAKKYYSTLGRDIDIIHLNGSIEIAPILGLSDVIVDIVETGTTLRENGLEVKDEIVPISARLIANKSGYEFKRDVIERIRANIVNGLASAANR